MLATIGAGLALWLVAALGARVVLADPFGFSPSSFQVAADGQANYSIPIQAPSGIGGIQPQLALVYDSSSDNDLAGVGWSLTGLSSIERCGKTIATDGDTGGVTHSAEDRFCLDGLRLIATKAGRYGSPNMLYRTEIETFTKVRSRGSVPNANGGPPMPAWFEVRANDGLIMTFGSDDPNDRSRVTLPGTTSIQKWMLRTLRDRFGNTMTVHYHQRNWSRTEDYVPRLIEYTSNPSQGTAAFARVEFVYERKPNGYDNVRRMVSGGAFRNFHRLTAIRTFDKNTLVRDYRLSYDNNGIGNSDATAGQSRLIALQECGGDGTCLPKSRFSWSGAAPNWAGSGGFGGLAPAQGHADTDKSPFASGDFNGDGRTDIARVEANAVAVRVSTGTGFANYPNNLPDFGKNSAPSGDEYPLITGDFDGDGRTDLGRVYGNEVRFWRATGTGWERLASLTGGVARRYGLDRAYVYPIVTGDFDADGRTDVARVTQTGVDTWLFRGDRWVSYPFLSDFGQSRGYPHTGQFPIFSGDFNGDGRTDIARVGSDSVKAYIATAQGFVSYPSGALNQFARSNGHPNSNRYPLVTGDFNADGLTDVARVNGGGVSVVLSTGHGWIEHRDLPDFGFHRRHYPDSVRHPLVVADFNGDGRDDLGRVHADGLRIYTSTGFGWFGVAPLGGVGTNSGFSNTGKHPLVVADFSGDGISDFARFNQGGLRAWRQRADADRITRIRDGYGKEIRIHYRPMSDKDTYTAGDDVAYPRYNVMPAQYLVARVERANGRGGFASWQYRYGGMRLRHDRREGPGFAFMQVIDQQAGGLETITEFNQKFPFLGQPTRIRTVTGANVKVSEVNYQHKVLSYHHASGKQSWLPVVTAEEVQEYEPANHGRLVRRTQTSYRYGAHGSSGQNFGEPTQITHQVFRPNGTREHVTNTFLSYLNPDTQKWLLNRVSREHVRRNLPNGDTRHHITDYQWRANTRRLQQVIREPDQANFRLNTALYYDGHGNLTRTVVSGGGITQRETQVRYRGDGGHVVGRFPTWSQNAEGHVSTHQFDSRCGGTKLSTDPNGLSTRWHYDSLCRLVSEQLPYQNNQTATRWQYQLNGNGQRYAINVNSPGSPWTQTVYDELGRAIRINQQGFDNRTVSVNAVYDYQGRLLRQSRPYFSGNRPQHWTQYRYDDLSRVTTMTEPAPNGGTMTSRYQYNGLVTTATDPKNKHTRTTRDVRGLIVAVHDHSRIGSSPSMRYAYDADGNLIRTQDVNNNRIDLTYDRLGRKVAMRDPDMGTWRYHYDALGQLTRQQDGRGQQIHLQYDRLGRLLSRNTAAGTSTWKWDTAGRGIGQLASTSGPNYFLSHNYDQFGRLFQTRIKIANTDMTARLSYDQFGRVNQRDFPGPGLSVQNQYNGQGYLHALYSPTLNQTLWRATRVDAEGHFEEQRFGNGLITQMQFDPGTGDLQRILSGPSHARGLAQNLSYRWDEVGNLLSREDRNGAVRASERFQYDDLHRLTATLTNANGQNLRVDVRYDAIGNITYKSDVGTYHYGASNN
ncbi:MAG: FG-GAP-like repeat-containing protein, partial [Gammaproteobacteria bacterium]